MVQMLPGLEDRGYHERLEKLGLCFYVIMSGIDARQKLVLRVKVKG